MLIKKPQLLLKLNGTGTVIGSLIVSGNSVDMNISNGTFEALYSKETLDNAKIKFKIFTISNTKLVGINIKVVNYRLVIKVIDKSLL